MIGIGIDTGGTYTDAVVYNLEKREIMAGAKALTTREDLKKRNQKNDRKAFAGAYKKGGAVFKRTGTDCCGGRSKAARSSRRNQNRDFRISRKQQD